jgi:hypothetical protein
MFAFLEDLAARCGNESCSCAGSIYEIHTTVEAYHQRIEAEIAWHVASNNELLAETD